MTWSDPIVGAGFKPAPTAVRVQRRRRSLRLEGYDYSQAGGYFVTICTYHRKCLFGYVDESCVRLNEIGLIAQRTWHDLPSHYPHVSLDAFVVMPNHVHGVVMFVDEASALPTGAGLKPAPTKFHALPEIVRAFKTFSARAINNHQRSRGKSLWQRNYYEHVIRDEKDLGRIRRYIAENPARWAEDSNNPVLWDRLQSRIKGRV
ncbi:MAG TPA: transposase [Xanthobacteraceae bacterium]|jgi:REP element-mobilizing transposase RayT|nr:transposase [Xanthobacteraceae bacterium]